MGQRALCVFPWLPPVLKQADAVCEMARPADWQPWIRDSVSALSASTARSDKHRQPDPETRDASAFRQSSNLMRFYSSLPISRFAFGSAVALSATWPWPGGGRRGLFRQFLSEPLLIGSPLIHPVRHTITISQSVCCLCFMAGPFSLHYSKSFSYSIFLLHQQDLSILSGLEYLWKVYFICFFFIATFVQIGPHRVPSPCPCSNGNVNMGK